MATPAGAKRLLHEAAAAAAPDRPSTASDVPTPQAGDALVTSWMTARTRSSAGQIHRFTVKTLATRLVGGTVIADVTFEDGSTVTIRMGTRKARLLVMRLAATVGMEVG